VSTTSSNNDETFTHGTHVEVAADTSAGMNESSNAMGRGYANIHSIASNMHGRNCGMHTITTPPHELISTETLKFKRYGEHDAAQQMQVLIKCGGYIET
jgi:hypothetical protein